MNVQASSNQPMLAVLTTRLEKLQKDLTSQSCGKVNSKGFEQALKGAVNKAQGTEESQEKVTSVKQHRTSASLKTVQSQNSSVVDPAKDDPQSAKSQQTEDDQVNLMAQVMGLLQMLNGLAGKIPPGQVTGGADVTGDASKLSTEKIVSMLQKLLETQLQALGFKDAGQLSQQLLTLAGVLPDPVLLSGSESLPSLEKLDVKLAQQLIAQLDETLQNAGVGQTGGQAQTGLVEDPEQFIVQSLQKLVEKYSQAQGTATSQANAEGNVDAFQQSPRFQQLVSELKPLLEQLAKGGITAENAAQQILAKPGLLDLIAQQVRMVQVKENQASTTPAPQATISQGDVGTGLNMAPSPKAATAQKNEPSQKGEKASEPNTSAIRAKSDPDQSTDLLTGNHRSTNGLVSTEQLGERPQLALHLNPIPVAVGSDNTQTNAPALAEKPQQATVYRQLATSLVMNQLVESSQVLVGKDHSQIKIQLKPDFLGKVALQVSVENGVVKAEIAAESQQVKQLIEANLGSLKQHLSDQGLKVEQLVVSLGQGQTQSGNTREQSPQGGKGSRRNQQGTAAFEIGDITAEYGGHLTEDQVVDYKI